VQYAAQFVDAFADAHQPEVIAFRLRKAGRGGGILSQSAPVIFDDQLGRVW
jgi:hypothetical protein